MGVIDEFDNICSWKQGSRATCSVLLYNLLYIGYHCIPGYMSAQARAYDSTNESHELVYSQIWMWELAFIAIGLCNEQMCLQIFIE